MKFAAKQDGGGSGTALKDLIKIEDGKSVAGILRGDPVHYHQHWVGNRSAICSGEDCSHCRNGSKRQFKFKLNMIVKENGALVAKILEMGWSVYDQLEILSTDYDLENWTVKITRRGVGQQTEYTVTPLPDGKVSSELAAKLNTISLHELIVPVAESSNHAPQASSAAINDNDDDIPF